MKAEELMIGDWVIVYEKAMPVKARVDGVYGNNAFCLGHPRPVENGFVKYIPITPEILEKNYSSTPEWYFDGTNKYCLRISRYKDKWNFYYGRGSNGVQIQINIQYVHELQHALRLCGINKTIEL